MKNRTSRLRHLGINPRRPGFALVVALTAIVLITVIVLAFFSKALLNRQISFTSTNQIKSDMLARTALDIVVGEVRQEIVDYSIPPTNGIYFPLSGSNALPIKAGVTGADTNTGAFTITKVAAADTKIDPGTNGKTFGSTVTLDTSSRNGRSIPQWYAGGPNLGTANLPSWSYLSRGGGIVTNVTPGAKNPSETNLVTGRFSYTVYNVGGLLDANIAGYPSIASATNVASKSSIAYADLTTIGLDSTKINDLVAWRNPGASSNAMLFDIWATGIDRTNTATSKAAATAAANGYLQTAYGDNAFFSRRDLLRYLGARGSTNAASALTHFSRNATAPTWGPLAVQGSSINYQNEATSANGINRLVPTVKAFDGIITDYSDDGTPTVRAVTKDEPLVQRKFSLAKLAWIGHDGPNTAAFSPTLTAAQREQAIKTCFGLTWMPNSNAANGSSDAHWEYDHGNPQDILILDEVRVEKRAPDFFELLKAGILHGSLGTQPGRVANDISVTKNAQGQSLNDSPDWKGPIGRDFESYSADEDRHILQIGANIIDQADANNFPTAIHMDLINKYTGQERLFFNMVFGLENLPMLQRMGVINSKPTAHDMTPGMMNVWMQPEFWNPNEKSTVGLSPTDPNYPTPTALRLTTYGKSYVWNSKEYTDPTHSTPVDFGTNFYQPLLDGIICFKNPSPTSTSPINFFDTPRSITGYERASNSKKYEDFTSPSGPRNRYPAGALWVGSGNANNQFIGVFVGETEFDPNYSNTYEFRTMIDGYLTFVAEYYDGTDWRPYCSISRLETLHANAGSSNSIEGTPFVLSTDGHIDPRTSRLSGSAGRTATGANVGWGMGFTVRSGPSTAIALTGAIGRASITQAPPRADAGQDSQYPTQVTFTHNPVQNTGLRYLFDDWAINLATAANDKPVSSFRYSDPDSITRPGDSWRANYSTGDGVMTYHATETPESAQRRRAVILNRPFRSVGELGYVFRDLPFKSLDMWSTTSSDAALLDLFAVSDRKTGVTAGMINPSVSPPRVLESLFSGAGNQATTNSTISTAGATTMAQSVAVTVTADGPLGSPADIVSKLSDNLYAAATNSATNSIYQNKTYGEAPVRALSSVTSTRTWNLLIDVVAQSGRLATGATDLKDFIVEGEKRYWLHLAIDRQSGEILDRQLEAVYE